MTQFGADARDATCPDEPAPVRGYLAVNGLQWRLRNDTNLDHLEAQIKAAMRSGDPFAIETEAPDTDGRSARIVLNGHALPYVVLWEQPGSE
jgi:hypothetical protein